MSDPSAGDADPGAEPAITEPPAVPKSDRSVPPWLSRAIAMAAGWVVLLFAAYWALGRLRTLLVMVLVAFFLSLAMEPAVDRLARRGWRRGSATGSCSVACWSFTLVFLAAAGSIVVGQASDLIDNAPRYVRDFERFVNEDLGIEFDADSLVRELQERRRRAQRRQRRRSCRARSVSRSPWAGGCSTSSPCSSSRST